ncbi:MAG: hypothetical protein MJY86_07900 [Bacteroidales bacterium]|nr:hypothetical protein [Bacteroidales bacterium]
MTQIVLNIENKSVAASLKKVLATMDGVTITSTKSLSAYEKSKLEAKSGKVNHYSSVDELFAKVGQ